MRFWRMSVLHPLPANFPGRYFDLTFCHATKNYLSLPSLSRMVKSGMEAHINNGGQAEAGAMVIESGSGPGKKFYIESYGCQMNFSDSEIVASILTGSGYHTTKNIEEADAIFLNTCSIRDKAEKTVRQRISTLRRLKEERREVMIGVLGCMAERMKHSLLEEEKLVDIVAGPDAYRDLPKLMEDAGDGRRAINVLLSREETYAEINPVRLDSNGITALISIMRGCDNMCTFCVVPFTRGRERSRDPNSILSEATGLYENGYREVTLLGQNVDSYLWTGGGLKKDIKHLPPHVAAGAVNFAALLERTAAIHPDLRIRFSTSHPKDMTDDVLAVMARHKNICRYIHLPFQSGSNKVLERMNRGYTREWYLDRIAAIRSYMPDCAVSADIMAGFCGETEEDHNDTMKLMEEVKFSFSYMFRYSERPKTLAQRKYADDVDEGVKQRRLSEIINLQLEHSAQRSREYIGKTCEVLVEGPSRKGMGQLSGRNSQNAPVVFPAGNQRPGTFVNVRIEDCTATTLIGIVAEGRER